MSFEVIKPEVYTFLDFAKHGYEMGKRRGNNTLTCHLGGEIPTEHPMPYNVYVKVREFLLKNPKAIDEIKDYIKSELEKPFNGFKNVDVTVGRYVEKKGLFKKIEYPQIDVRIDW